MKKILIVIGLSLAFVSPLYACWGTLGWCTCHIPDIPSQRLVQNQGHANTYGLNPTINEAQNEAQNEALNGNHMLLLNERNSQERMQMQEKLSQNMIEVEKQREETKRHEMDLDDKHKRYIFEDAKQNYNLKDQEYKDCFSIFSKCNTNPKCANPPCDVELSKKNFMKAQDRYYDFKPK